jgi:hypothetical protein
MMDYFVIEMGWDAKGNSPWDALWHEYGVHEMCCLSGSMPLAPIWKSPKVTFQKRKQRPDIIGFVLHFAVTERVRDILLPLVKEEAEFLPLEPPDAPVFYLIHPLLPVDFNDEAVVNARSGANITRVDKYSFTLSRAAFSGPRHLFRMRQGKNSPSRSDGIVLNNLIVSEKFKELCEEANVQGIRFQFACRA